MRGILDKLTVAQAVKIPWMCNQKFLSHVRKNTKQALLWVVWIQFTTLNLFS
jgi:hypothetical protein